MITAIVQARMGSTRLPGKTMRPILSKPMLALQIERIGYAKLVDQIVIATTGSPEDMAISQFAQESGIPCVRGALDDVLDRYYQAAKRFSADQIVRLTGDCPLIDPDVIDNVIRAHMSAGNDYTSNVHPPSFPDGLDVEVFTFAALDRAWGYADKPSEREHVTSYFRRNLDNFTAGNVTHGKDLSHLRLTVDEEPDFEVVKTIFQNLYMSKRDFGLEEIVRYLEDNPHVAAHNGSLERNSGYKASLEKDAVADIA